MIRDEPTLLSVILMRVAKLDPHHVNERGPWRWGWDMRSMLLVVGVCTVVLCVMFLTTTDWGPAEAAADAATRRAVDRHYRSPRIDSISLSRRFSALH